MDAKRRLELERLAVALTMNVAPFPDRHWRSTSFSGWSSSIVWVSTWVTASRARTPASTAGKPDWPSRMRAPPLIPKTGRLSRIDRDIAHAQKGTMHVTGLDQLNLSLIHI